MHVGHAELRDTDDGAVMEALVESRSGRDPCFTLRMLVRGVSRADLGRPGDALMACLLPIAMALGEPIELEDPVSPVLYDHLATVQEIYRAWSGVSHGPLVPVEIVAPLQAVPDPTTRVVQCFTGGVDSWYTLMKRLTDAHQPVTDLLFVGGYDIPLARSDLLESAVADVSAIADELGVRSLVVESNLRSLSDAHVSWALFHGAALVSVALLLGTFRRVLLASSWSYANLRPWGSHPLLDPLWSTEATQVVHDGCEARRWQKVERVATSPLALSWLRVCWQERPAGRNCGRCEKCLLTMVMLDFAGVMDRCEAFDAPFDLRAVRSLDMRGEVAATVGRDLLRAMEERQWQTATADALRVAMRRSRRRDLAVTVARGARDELRAKRRGRGR